MVRKQSLVIFQSNCKQQMFCGAKTKRGYCKNPSMKNGRCRLHGGLTPKNHPNHQARFNALKSGYYSKHTKTRTKVFADELKAIDHLILKCKNKGIS